MEGAAQTLVGNVAQLVGEEFRQLSGVGGEVARLRNELTTINALLRMQSEADEGAVDHFVREWMKQLREVAYDAEDCVDLYLFRVRCPSGSLFFVRSKRFLSTLLSRHRLASDIRALRALASSINEQHARYGVSLEALRRTAGPSLAVPPAAALALRPADKADDPVQFVGIKAHAIALAKKVKALDHENDKELKVFSIVGFGGLGKTTLAVEVCRQLETEFQPQAQVSVSQTFSAKDLLGLMKRVLKQIAQHQTGSLDNIDAMNVDELEKELNKRLENNRYLILIDDVWTIAAWDAIQSKLPSSNCGSRVIVTTRIDTVAKACSGANNDDCIHHMKKLDDKDSEQLFVSKAFGSGMSCPKDLEALMRSILKKCGGLPLAIVSIGSLLASYKSPEGKQIWETVQKSIGSQMEINPTLDGMSQILTLSYNHLPHHLKACMMYLSIFPEDYMIVKDRLFKRWIAEGLIVEKRGLTQMEIAEGYFNELLSRSMIDRASNLVTLREGREEGCRVHDMMLEILVSKSLEANFVSLVGGQYEGMSYANTIRRLSIHGGGEAHEDSSSNNMAARHGTGNGIRGMMVQHVRSLSIFDPESYKLLGRLGEFTLLRVLDLEDCKGLGKMHMNCICRMYLLRFLSLKGTDIMVIPRRIGDLEHLQTLDVRQTLLKNLPETVIKLDKLEHLLFSGQGDLWSGWMLPQGINKMKALRQVNKAAVIYDPKVAQEIGELDQLQELAIYVDTREEMNMQVVEELACSLSKMNSLRWLDIGNLGCYKWPFSPIMKFLHDVESPPRLLRYLKICGCIDRMPDWVESLTDIVEFDIGWTYLDGVQLFNVLCKLPNLKRLYLGPYFIRKYEDMVARSTQPFPELKELTLGYSPEVPPVYIFEEGSMPKLEMLAMYFGDQPKEIVGMEHLTNLKQVHCDGWRDNFKRVLEQVEELNQKRDMSEQITVRVIYEDR